MKLIRIILSCLIINMLPVLCHGKESLLKSRNYGYIKLCKGVPVLKQVNKESTIYEINHCFDLKGDTLVLPRNCVLKFVGGCLINGHVVFDKTVIESNYRNIFKQISVSGNVINNEVWLSWWQLAYDKGYNDAILINQIVRVIDNCIFYYDIQKDIYIGTDKTDGRGEETIEVHGKKNLKFIQTTEHFTRLRGRSAKGGMVGFGDNKYIYVDGLKVDGGNVYYSKWGENGIGVGGNEKVVIENCVIKNCYSNCFDSLASGTLLKNGYPEWGTGGKGIQIEGGSIKTHAVIRNNTIENCYIGISNNAFDGENIIIDGNHIDSCYMSIILLRLNSGIRMNVNIDNTIITNNIGDVGAICMGDASNVCISNTQVKGEKTLKSVLRGCFSYSNIQLIVSQKCESLIDAALYRDNPEGKDAHNNYVRIISEYPCDNIINTSKIIPKRNGGLYANYVSNEFEIILPGRLRKTPIVIPALNNTSRFNIHMGERILSGNMSVINK